MKYLILALLAGTFSEFVATAEAGKTTHCNGDPMKDLNLHKSGSGGKGGTPCVDSGPSERVLSQQGRVEDESIKNSGHASERTTVNNSKSNSYRLEGGKNDGGNSATERDKLKGSTKSNTSDVAGSVGKTTVNGTKSNSYRLEGGKNDGNQDRATTVKGSKSNGSS